MPTPRSTRRTSCSEARERAVHEWMSLEIYTRLGNTRLCGITELNLGVQAYADGKWSEAVDLYTRAQEDCLRAGDRPNAAIAAANLGELLVSRVASTRRSVSPPTPGASCAPRGTCRSHCSSRRSSLGARWNAARSPGRPNRSSGSPQRRRASTTPASCSRSPSTVARRRAGRPGRRRARGDRCRRSSGRRGSGALRGSARARPGCVPRVTRPARRGAGIARAGTRGGRGPGPALRAAPHPTCPGRTGRRARHEDGGAARGRTPRAAPRTLRLRLPRRPEAVDGRVDVRVELSGGPQFRTASRSTRTTLLRVDARRRVDAGRTPSRSAAASVRCRAVATGRLRQDGIVARGSRENGNASV